jgi:hypothetical protein
LSGACAHAGGTGKYFRPGWQKDWKIRVFKQWRSGIVGNSSGLRSCLFRGFHGGKSVGSCAAGGKCDEQILGRDAVNSNVCCGLHYIIFDAANHIVQCVHAASKEYDDPVLPNTKCAGNFERVGKCHEPGASGCGVEKTPASTYRLSCRIC